ncbi:MAG TPA: hypothetical protein PLP61_14900 [Nocardioides sp.]|uniref:hypothetical protein n=1 Tax=Nocardioides sp. TaxID=35761 RepID=UPI002BCDBC9D|nr:hypothetical protein [Nocardioides sp.]HQR28328.1 hypothetical protein [Nocardioides sp.]
MIWTARGRVTAAVLATGLALGAVSCSGDSEPEPAASPSASAPAPLQTTARLGRVEGTVDRAQRARTVAAVSSVVDGWWDAAYVGGDYPRTDFSDAFPGFTPGAAKDAAADLRLMSNAEIGERVDAVTARTRRVSVDVLGVKGRPVGATARVRLAFTTSGERKGRVTVTGVLRLTKTDAGWQVFAYDVSEGGAR